MVKVATGIGPTRIMAGTVPRLGSGQGKPARKAGIGRTRWTTAMYTSQRATHLISAMQQKPCVRQAAPLSRKRSQPPLLAAFERPLTTVRCARDLPRGIRPEQATRGQIH